jgi:peptidoglycan-associated lipoprotein
MNGLDFRSQNWSVQVCRNSLGRLFRNGVLLAVIGSGVAACQRPPDPLAQAPMFFRTPAVRPEPPAPTPTQRPTLADFIAYAGSTRVYFERDSDLLDGDARAILDRQADWLLRNPQVTASLQGHADMFGGRERQFAIGEMRASAMRRYLVARGVQPARLEVTSFGKQKPQTAVMDLASQRQNRRGETVLHGVAGTANTQEGN